jgi:hypothetical protein
MERLTAKRAYIGPARKMPNAVTHPLMAEPHVIVSVGLDDTLNDLKAAAMRLINGGQVRNLAEPPWEWQSGAHSALSRLRLPTRGYYGVVNMAPKDSADILVLVLAFVPYDAAFEGIIS